MRFLGLDLERYGPFTERGIHFREGARLHVVHGPNEAGKSTALAAIGDLLFGFPPRASQDFLHRMQDLRIGARIVNRAGDRLSFRRRRGNLRTLIDAEENALANDALVPFLGGLTRDIFARAFGLSTETLRKGGKDMLQEKGDVGSALFAAASGLQGSSELRRSLDAEAERIFDTRSAGHRRFYQALDRWEAARKAMREQELRGGDWKELNERIAGLETRLVEIVRQRAEQAAERARLLRLKRVAPLLRLLDESLAEIEGLGSVPDVRPGYAERLRAALAAEQGAAAEAKSRAEEIGQLADERDRLAIDEALVVQADRVEALHSFTEKYVGARTDLPRVKDRVETLRRNLGMLAARLGLVEGGMVKERQPSDASLALIRGLLDEGRDLARRAETLRADLERESAEKAKLDRQRSEQGGDISNPDALRERLRDLQPTLRRLDGRAELEATIGREEEALVEAGARLDPPVSALNALANAPLPNEETLARFRKDQETLERRLDRAHAEVEAADKACREIALTLERLVSARPVPTAALIGQARGHRDAEWEKLRPVLFGATAPLEERSAAASAFERHQGEADRLTDAAVEDAERVAKHLVETQRLAAERARHEEAAAALARVQSRWRSHDEAWRATWSTAGVLPKTPAEMAPWLTALRGLLLRREALRTRQEHQRRLEAEAAAIAPSLSGIAEAASLKVEAELSPHEVAARVEDRIKRLSADWERVRGVEAKAEAAADHLARLEAKSREATLRREEWTGKWRAALLAVGLSPDFTLDQVEAAQQAWKEAPGLVEHLAEEEQRVAGMRRDNTEFEARTGELLAAVAPDLEGEPADVAMKTLQQRASAARAVAARRQDCLARLAAGVGRSKAAEVALGQARSLLGALAKEAGLGESGSLRPLLASLDQRAALEADLRGKRDELLRAADGLDETMLRAELAGFDPGMAEKRLAELGQEEESLVRQGQEAYATQQQALSRKAALEAGFGAELAAQQRRNAEAQLTETAREWAVLKLGSLLLGAAIERHREAAQNPLLTRAGKLFSAITGGAFHGLGSRFDEEDRPVLIGRRADGSNVEVDGLSEGTRDQLFLALRLAYVESYAARAEPPPFIADDIFVTFDDERTAHGLVALAGIGARVQPILFSHHRRVVEIARERLGEDVDIVELSA